MGKERKKTGEVYTPVETVKRILNFGRYDGDDILCKYVIDNSCGDGAFLGEIVDRYISMYRLHCKANDRVADKDELKEELECYIWGVDISPEATIACRKRLNAIAGQYGIFDVKWNIICADALSFECKDMFWQDIKFDYVFGNPPYVRVHDIDGVTRENIQKFKFTHNSMTDLYLAFMERCFQILAPHGTMCVITPSSWLKSKAGEEMRKFVIENKLLNGIIDLGHDNPFYGVTCYTAISRFSGSSMENPILEIQYMNTADSDCVSYNKAVINGKIYLADENTFDVLKKIICGKHTQYVTVKTDLPLT